MMKIDDLGDNFQKWSDLTLRPEQGLIIKKVSNQTYQTYNSV